VRSDGNGKKGMKGAYNVIVEQVASKSKFLAIHIHIIYTALQSWNQRIATQTSITTIKQGST
jgi:hypothetical protein